VNISGGGIAASTGSGPTLRIDGRGSECPVGKVALVEGVSSDGQGVDTAEFETGFDLPMTTLVGFGAALGTLSH
jgi:hypothetical protein